MEINRKSIIRLGAHLLFWGILIGPLYAKVILYCEECRVLPEVLSHFIILAGSAYLNIYFFIPKARKGSPVYWLGVVALPAIAASLLGIRKEVFRAEEISISLEEFGRSLLMVGFLSFLAFLFESFFKYLDERKRIKLLEQEQVKSELALLKNQINPHFLFNTLNSLYSLSLKKSDHLPDAILNLSDYLEYSMKLENRELVPLAKELEFMEKYVELEKLRLSDKVHLSYTWDTSKCNDFQIAPMILPTLLENAFKHSAPNKKGEHFIKIEISVAKRLIHFKSANSYSNAHLTESAGGKGLENVKKRLSLIYDNHEFNVSGDKEVFSVCLEIPAL